MWLELDIGSWTWNKMTQPRPVVRRMKLPHYFSVGEGWQFLSNVENILFFPLPLSTPYRPTDHKSWMGFPMYEGQWGRSLHWGLKSALKDTSKKHSLNLFCFPQLGMQADHMHARDTRKYLGRTQLLLNQSEVSGHCTMATAWSQRPNLYSSAALSSHTDMLSIKYFNIFAL